MLKSLIRSWIKAHSRAAAVSHILLQIIFRAVSFGPSSSGAIPVTSCGVNLLEDSYQLHVMFPFPPQFCRPSGRHLNTLLSSAPRRPLLSGAQKVAKHICRELSHSLWRWGGGGGGWKVEEAKQIRSQCVSSLTQITAMHFTLVSAGETYTRKL